MTATTDAPADSQPWDAFILDRYGYVMSDEHIRGWVDTKSRDLDADYHFTDSEPDELVIVRGTARPVPEGEGSDFMRQAGTYTVEDVLLWEPVDVSGAGPQEVLTLWERAVAVAKAANDSTVR